jgi:hypothetical protein
MYKSADKLYDHQARAIKYLKIWLIRILGCELVTSDGVHIHERVLALTYIADPYQWPSSRSEPRPNSYL